MTLLGRPRRAARHLVLAIALAACPAEDPAPEPVRHVVVRGETLGRIAAAHGVSVDELRTWNDLEGDLIEVGQVLVVHGSGRASGAPSAPSTRKPKSKTAPAPAQSDDTLRLPPELPCLAPPDADPDDEGFATRASAGLSTDQVKGAFNAFAPRMASCLPDGWTGTATVQLDLRIACTGRVADAEVVSAGGLPDDVQRCLLDRVRYAPFPAHDLPDGERARVPLRLFAEAP